MSDSDAKQKAIPEASPEQQVETLQLSCSPASVDPDSVEQEEGCNRHVHALS